MGNEESVNYTELLEVPGELFLNMCLHDAVDCLDYTYKASVADEWMGMEQRWKDKDRGKPKYLEKNLPQCHFVHHEFHVDWSQIEPRQQLTA